VYIPCCIHTIVSPTFNYLHWIPCYIHYIVSLAVFTQLYPLHWIIYIVLSLNSPCGYPLQYHLHCIARLYSLHCIHYIWFLTLYPLQYPLHCITQLYSLAVSQLYHIIGFPTLDIPYIVSHNCTPSLWISLAVSTTLYSLTLDSLHLITYIGLSTLDSLPCIFKPWFIHHLPHSNDQTRLSPQPALYSSPTSLSLCVCPVYYFQPCPPTSKSSSAIMSQLDARRCDPLWGLSTRGLDIFLLIVATSRLLSFKRATTFLLAVKMSSCFC